MDKTWKATRTRQTTAEQMQVWKSSRTSEIAVDLGPAGVVAATSGGMLGCKAYLMSQNSHAASLMGVYRHRAALLLCLSLSMVNFVAFVCFCLTALTISFPMSIYCSL